MSVQQHWWIPNKNVKCPLYSLMEHPHPTSNPHIIIWKTLLHPLRQPPRTQHYAPAQRKSSCHPTGAHVRHLARRRRRAWRKAGNSSSAFFTARRRSAKNSKFTPGCTQRATQLLPRRKRILGTGQAEWRTGDSRSDTVYHES